MRSGRLLRAVTIEQLGAGSPRQGSSGERLDAWTSFAAVRAGIRTLSGRELAAAQQRNSEITVEAEIRYLAGVQAGMRIAYRSEYFSILSVRDPDLRRRKLLLDCSAGVVNPAVTS